MQKRMQRLLLNTISYIERISSVPFCESAVLCALHDLEDYSIYAGCDEIYLSIIQSVVRHYNMKKDGASVVSLLSGLKKHTLNYQAIMYVDFIILRQTHWGTMKPLIDAFIESKCHVRIIPTPMIQEKQDHWGKALSKIIQQDGYTVQNFEQYDIEKALPDIVIDNMAVDCAKIPEFRFLRVASLVDNTVHIEHSILTGYNEAMKRSRFRLGRSRCWQYVVPSPLFSISFPLIFRIDGEYLPMGCPELDSIYSSQAEHIKRCKVFSSVLWNVDALDPDTEIPGDYERLAKEIEYLEAMAQSYPDIIQIVRKHPNFCNQKKCEQLSKTLDNLICSYDNIRYDTNKLIYETYKEIDAMVTWMSSSTLFSFAATGKPIIVMPTFIDGGYDTMLDMYLLSVIPVAFSLKDMYNFFDNMKADVNKKTRIEVLQKYTGPLDGNASKRIAEEVFIRYDRFFD